MNKPLNQFFNELKQITDWPWKMSPAGVIRTEKGDEKMCPLEAVHYHKNGEFFTYMAAGKSLGIERDMITVITGAADNEVPICKLDECRICDETEPIRREILSILGLEDS